MLPFRRDKVTPPDSVPGPFGASSSSSTSSASGSLGRRLLRRKPSIVALKSGDESDSGSTSITPSLVPHTASTTSTFSDRLESLEDSSSSDWAHISSTHASPPASASSSSFPGRTRERRGSEPVLLPKQVWDHGGNGAGSSGVVIIDSTGDTGPTRIGAARLTERRPSLAAMGGAAMRPGHPFISLDPGSAYGYDLTPAPSYPTALSPPPRPKSRQGDTTPVVPQAAPAPQAPANTAYPAHPGNGSTVAPSESGVTGTPRKRINAEWLAQKPSRRDYSPTGLPARTHARTASSSLSPGRPITPARAGEDSRADVSQEGFLVEAVCSRTEEGDLKWEVVIRRRPTAGPTSTSISPLALSTNPIMANVPSTSTSINLSLALDQPTGKLAFISMPDTLQSGSSTPRRPRPLTSSNSAPSSAARPTTPPPAPNPNSSPTPVTPPGASSTSASGTAPSASGTGTSRASHKKRISESALWPSPSQAGRQSPGIPLASPRRGEETWTPRRMRFVTAGELSGGLYAPGTTGTIEALSEELSSVSMASVSGTLAPAPALTFAPASSASASASSSSTSTSTLGPPVGSRPSSSDGRRQAAALLPSSLEEDRSARVARWEGAKI